MITSTNFPVSSKCNRNQSIDSDFHGKDGGWLEANEIPTGKSRFGSFNQLSEENRRIIRNILERKTTPESSAPSFDDLILTKVQDMYSSCMNEDLLNDRGTEPLLEVVKVVRDLYQGSAWMDGLHSAPDEDEENKHHRGLTAAVAFLHSRGSS